MTTHYGRKKTVIVVIVVIAIALGIFISILLTRRGQMEDGCIEKQTIYKVTPTGATIIAFNSVPKNVIESLKTYIVDKGYNGEDISFVFQTSPFTAVSGYTWQKDMFYVVQDKDNTGPIDFKYNRSCIYIGELVIDIDGNVVETQYLITADDLSKLRLEPSISFEGALQIARDYLGLDENFSTEIWSWRFCTPHNYNEWILCFMIKFKDVEETVYIDGFSGQIIELPLNSTQDRS